MVEGDIFKFLEHIVEYLTCCAWKFKKNYLEKN